MSSNDSFFLSSFFGGGFGAGVITGGACLGGGLTRCMSYQVHEQLMSGQLCTVLDDYQLPALPLHVVYREGRRAAARVRSFVDFAVAQLRDHPALN